MTIFDGDLILMSDIDAWFGVSVRGVKDVPQVLLGDVNGDGLVNSLDVSPFVALIPNGGFSLTTDLNQDGLVNLLDIDPFVLLLAAE